MPVFTSFSNFVSFSSVSFSWNEAANISRKIENKVEMYRSVI